MLIFFLAPSKRNIQSKIINEGGNGIFRIEFFVQEVGTHLVDVSVAGHKFGNNTLLAKGYNSALIRVTDVSDAVVGQPCQFRGLLKTKIILNLLFFINY